MEQPHYAFANQSTELATDLSDQPLDFAPRFARDHDPHMQPNYTHAWTPPPAPGALYPPVIPSGPQVLSFHFAFEYSCYFRALILIMCE